MKTKINLIENDPCRELGWDEFWEERNRLEAEGWKLVMSYPDTESGKRNFVAGIRSQENQKLETKVIRRSGFMVVLSKNPDKKISEITADAEEAICEETRPDIHNTICEEVNLRSVA